MGAVQVPGADAGLLCEISKMGPRALFDLANNRSGIER
jgi:hypothetical protein